MGPKLRHPTVLTFDATMLYSPPELPVNRQLVNVMLVEIAKLDVVEAAITSTTAAPLSRNPPAVESN